MGREELQKAESLSSSPWSSSYRKRGCHSGTQEVERQQCHELIAGITGQSAFNARLRCLFTLSGTGARPVPSVAAPPCFDTRPGQRCMRCHVGRQAAEVAQWWVFTKICMPPRWCLPSWLGRQLHANDGRGLTAVGLTVALRVFLARALPGPRQGSCRGTTVVLGKSLAGGLVGILGKDLAEDRRLLILI